MYLWDSKEKVDKGDILRIEEGIVIGRGIGMSIMRHILDHKDLENGVGGLWEVVEGEYSACCPLCRQKG